MLRGTYKRQYRINDDRGRRFVYFVDGTPEEIQAYKDFQAAVGWNRGDHDEATGTPVFIATEFIVANGRKIRQDFHPVINIGIRQDGRGAFIDDSKQMIAERAKEQAVEREWLGKLSAMQKFGLDIAAVFGGSSVPVSAPVQTPVEKPVTEDPNKVLEELNEGLKNSEPHNISEPVTLDDLGGGPKAETVTNEQTSAVS